MYTRMARLKNAQMFSEYIKDLAIDLPFDEILVDPKESPLNQPYILSGGHKIGNRFCVLPMEGWDGTEDGKPSELTTRRWIRFGRSGAKLIWGGEAVAVRQEGRANPRQLLINQHTQASLENLRLALVDEHHLRFGTTEDLYIGLQLTHSGRFSRPNRNDVLEPTIAYHHPVLDKLFNTPSEYPVMSDSELDDLVDTYVESARIAWEIGFDFVDIKHCHGYLAHELLSAKTRPGRYGGCIENRARFLREVVSGIRNECPSLNVGVRLSAFDFPPFLKDETTHKGQAIDYRDEAGSYIFAFGTDPYKPLQINLEETLQFIDIIQSLGIQLLCVTAGSPYYSYHIQRPAYFPSHGAYMPPEDPLVGVARQINATAIIKRHYPDMAIIGSAYSYLQEWVPNVAQSVVRNEMADFIGLGRMMLSYPEMPEDILCGNELDRKHICRTFSDCTSAPRNGFVSGCYPLDPLYKSHPDYTPLKHIQQNSKKP